MKEKQAIIRLVIDKIKELKGILETFKIEVDNSSDEEYSKVLLEVEQIPPSIRGCKKKNQVKKKH
jgi:hypothetical protein